MQFHNPLQCQSHRNDNRQVWVLQQCNLLAETEPSWWEGQWARCSNKCTKIFISRAFPWPLDRKRTGCLSVTIVLRVVFGADSGVQCMYRADLGSFHRFVRCLNRHPSGRPRASSREEHLIPWGLSHGPTSLLKEVWLEEQSPELEHQICEGMDCGSSQKTPQRTTATGKQPVLLYAFFAATGGRD